MAAVRRTLRPYASVVDIDRGRLPSPEIVAQWDGGQFAASLRHDAACAAYNPHFRQLLHVAYKVAAEMGGRFTAALERHADVIAANVTQNLYDRHLRPLFLADVTADYADNCVCPARFFAKNFPRWRKFF